MKDEGGLKGIAYLGDSVYAGRDEWGRVVMFLDNGPYRHHEIVLEPEVLQAFLNYLSRIDAISLERRDS